MDWKYLELVLVCFVIATCSLGLLLLVLRDSNCIGLVVVSAKAELFLAVPLMPFFRSN
jgi:hypothetical protein